MSTPEIKAAAQIARKRVEALMLLFFPTAKYFILYRETDWGESYNYLTDIWDENCNVLWQYRTDTNEFDDAFNDFVSQDFHAWLNNEGLNFSEYGFEIGGEGIFKEKLLPPAPSTKFCADDEVYLCFGIYGKNVPAGQTVDELRSQVYKMWGKTNPDLKKKHLFCSLDGITSADADAIPEGGYRVEFYRRVVEKTLSIP